MIRGLTPWPTAYTVLEGKKLKLFGSSVSAAKGGAGKSYLLNPFLAGCGDGVCVRIDHRCSWKAKNAWALPSFSEAIQCR